MRQLLLTAAVLLLTLPAVAREYVVDGSSPAASDDSPGTLDAPLRTINAAAQLVAPGDAVRVRPGLYREHVRLTRSGTQTAPVLLFAETPGTVTLTGLDPMRDWTRAPGAEAIYSAPWTARFVIDTRPDGSFVEHHPGNAPVWGRSEQVVVDGKQLGPVGSLEDLRKLARGESEPPAADAPPPIAPAMLDPLRPATWPGAFFADTAAQRLYVWLADGADPSAHATEAASRSQLFGLSPWENPAGVHDVQVRGFIFRNAATFPQRSAIWLHGERNAVEDCIIEEMSGAGVTVSGVLRRSVVRHCGQTGGCAAGSGFTNEECLWEENCWRPIDRGWDAGGVKLCLVDGGQFRRCVFRGNGGPGLWFDIHARNILVTECVFDGNEGSGLFIEISRDITVLRNLFIRNALTPPRSWSCGGVQIAESINCIVAQNTLVGNKDGITFREQGPRPLDTDDFGTIPYYNRGHVVTANVSALNQGYQLGLWYDNGFFGWHPAEAEKYKTQGAYEAYLDTVPDTIYDPTKQGTAIDRNLYFATDPARPAFLYGCEWRPKFRSFVGLADFTAYTGFDANSTVADPGFTDAARDNYRPAPGSLADQTQVGWLKAPEDPEAWMSSFLPAWR